MSERGPLESFDMLKALQEALGRSGYFFFPVERESTEALVTEPLVDRITRTIDKRGFRKVASHGVITFSGYSRDARELYEIPEVQAFWRKLNTQLDELPAVLAYLPQLNFNGPGLHLMLLGEIAEVEQHPERFGYDVLVADAPQIIDEAVARIHRASQKYRLSPLETSRVLEVFMQGVSLRLR